MTAPYYKLIKGAEAQLIEKKSRFIACVSPVDNETEAVDIITAAKKKYWDARHNVSAYVVGDESPLMRSTDDGEPAGTAGRPVLEVLTGRNIRGAVIVVTRYFGGVLLGTGGLVRAYSKAASDALDMCDTVLMGQGRRLSAVMDYAAWGRVQAFLSESGIAPVDTDYGDKVTVRIAVPEEQADGVISHITDISNGQAGMKEEYRGVIELR